ncbi:transcriptional regulator [Streptomyces aureoverticillatus]|uniref:transcriptional regulator n=1 Tax=Streptomyces aureoverticillatus TaxID=66871 RepID=UPI0013DD7908|nr:transcriptional regulator [Streptomyces aureoverticillatus]QIB49052.1 transcriptional regulator [Streptomyces aureoverticillatus]
MGKDFGRPPLAEENKARVEQRLKEITDGNGVRETLTVEWRTQPLYVEVIDMPVDALYYNPGTHRIRAQRSHDPERDKLLDEEPWAPRSQDYLHYLLQMLPADPSKRDSDFDDLQESLRGYRQNEPGLITRDGILVNGNTRRAALKNLGVANIRVGVLPESCTWDDINAVELSLQLRPDQRRVYSYINRLLAMEEQHLMGRTLADVAREFRIRSSTCEQDLWILSCLRDLIERSNDGAAQLRLLDFEQHQEKLRELYRRYAKESAVSKDNAEVLKETRLAAIVLGFSKTDVRLIEPDFRDRYLDKKLPVTMKTEDEAPAAVAIPGLNRTMKSAAPKVAQAKALTDTVLKAKAVERAEDGLLTERSKAAADTFGAARAAVEKALEPAGKDARVRKRKQAAQDRITDACQDIEQCITDLALAKASGSLDEEAFDEAVLSLRETLTKLAVATQRSIKAPGDGVSWLRESARQEGM